MLLCWRLCPWEHLYGGAIPASGFMSHLTHPPQHSAPGLKDLAESGMKIATAWAGLRGLCYFGALDEILMRYKVSWEQGGWTERGSVVCPKTAGPLPMPKEETNVLAAPCWEETRAPCPVSQEPLIFTNVIKHSKYKKNPNNNKPQTKNIQLLSYAISFNITCYEEIELNYLQQVYLHF